MLLPETLALHNREQFEFHYMYFLPWKDQMVSAITEKGGKVVCLNARNNIRIILAAKNIAAYIKQNNIDLVHCHLPWAGIAGRIAAKMAGVPVIYTEHNNFFRYHGLTRLVSKATMKMNDLVIPVSADAEKALKRVFGNKINIQLVLNGVDTVRFCKNRKNDAIRREFNIPADHVVILSVAVFRLQKRLDLWLQVVKKVIEARQNVSCILVGDGPLKQELQVKAEELKLGERFHMPGLRKDAPNFFDTADIFLMSSDFEGLPIALLEAMSMECAVVSTEAGGVTEVAEQNITGLLSPVGDVQALTANCIKLVDDAPQRNALGTAARKRIQKNFSMQRMVAELENIYKQQLHAI